MTAKEGMRTMRDRPRGRNIVAQLVLGIVLGLMVMGHDPLTVLRRATGDAAPSASWRLPHLAVNVAVEWR
jgi:hypothetical protein